MKKFAGVVVLLLVLLVGVAAYFHLQSSPALSPPAAAIPEADPAVEEGMRAEIPLIEDAIRYPVENVTAPGVEAIAPVPTLADSDSLVMDALAALLGGDPSQDGLLQPTDFIRRVVVTVDNLPGERLPILRAPLRMAEGSFRVSDDGGALVIDAANTQRYEPYIRLAESVGNGALVAAYVRLYPLFQAAYEELGYPSAYFNDRLVAVIDHLLEAPEVVGPIRVLQPKIRYVFESPALESLSAGQKLMVRIGVDNARRLKAKLRDLRARLAGVSRAG